MAVNLKPYYTPISRCSPRVKVVKQWECVTPDIQPINLYLQRVGEPQEFAVYSPIDVQGGVMLFQFDELLFSKPEGRYKARLVIGSKEVDTLYFTYTNLCAPAYMESVDV